MSPNRRNEFKSFWEDVDKETVYIPPEDDPALPPLVWVRCPCCGCTTRGRLGMQPEPCGGCKGAVNGCCDGAPLD